MTLNELKKKIEAIEITYDYEECYGSLYNTMIDYWNEEQNFFGEELFFDFIDYDTAEEYVRCALEDGGLARVYCFLGDINPMASDFFKIDGYGNLAEVYKDDIELLKEEIVVEINNRMA